MTLQKIDVFVYLLIRSYIVLREKITPLCLQLSHRERLRVHLFEKTLGFTCVKIFSFLQYT